MIDSTEALAHLLSDTSLRARFREDGSGTLEALDVRPEDRAHLLAVDPEGLDAQADTLIEKRRDEAAFWLPVTFARLGGDGERLFRRHAVGRWSSGADRSFVDALALCRALRDAGDARVCPLETNRLEVLASGKKVSLRLVRNANVAGRSRTVLHLVARRRGRRAFERLIYIAWYR